MRRRRLIAGAAGLGLVIAAVTATTTVALAGSPPNVTTGDYDNLRTNWDPNEPGLSPSVVRSAPFGRLFNTAVTGSVYAQPLVVDNTVIVTTERALAYGINAATGKIVWSRSFGTPVSSDTVGCSDLTPYVGSTSTPVEDPATGTVYLTTRLQTGPNGLAGSRWYLEAISATTGRERPGWPVRLAGTPDNTPDTPFDPANAMQRPALLLLGGVVYIGFASNCDITPYRGIVIGVDTTTRKITAMWSDESGYGTNDDSQAGIWQSGAGLVSDAAGRIILATANGESSVPAPSDRPPATLSESVVGLSVGSNGRLRATQFFSPSNAPTLDANDEDFGSGGPLALPTAYFGTAAHRRLLVQVGKDGRIFLLDADDMGGSSQGPGGSDAPLQMVGPFDGVWGHPAAYGGQGGWVYILESAGGGYLRALSYGVNGAGVPQLTSAGTSASPFGYTSGSPLVTSDGTRAGSAVVWVVYSSGPAGTSAELQAYGAIPTDGTLPLLWVGPIGIASKFSVPTAYDGRVYVGTRDGHLIAFGSSSAAPIEAAPLDFGSVPVGHGRTLTLSASVTENLRVRGPVVVNGYSGDVGAVAGSALAPSTPTAGPTTIPASGTTALTGSVVTVRQPRPGTSVRAGTTLRLRVTFRPVHAGPVVALVSIATSQGVRTVTVSGYGTAPGLLASAQPLRFGTVVTGSGGKELSATISNSWNRREAITGLALPGGPYRVRGLPAIGTVLAPRQAVTFSVSFDPTVAGSFVSSLRISSTAGALDLPVSGTAETGVARLAVSATTLDAGAVPVGRSVTLRFSVANTGTVPLTITRAIAPTGAFSTGDPLPEGIHLDPGAVLQQTISFRPTSTGPASGAYLLSGDTGQGPLTVTLTGTGT